MQVTHRQSMARVAESTLCARRLTLHGCVQGVGLRPEIARLARRNGLVGSVANSPAGVIIDVCGCEASLRQFERELEKSLPAFASVIGLEASERPLFDADGFSIHESTEIGPLHTAVPQDRAICRDCLDEALESTNRRYRHPFINCLNCGPRYSIIASLPYDRERTSMTCFEQCDRCRDEVESSEDRRFHSQANGCHECGPKLSVVGLHGDEVSGDAIKLAAESILAGQIVALKGIGGYQLLVDATNDDAVCELRRRKDRPTKPLAVMVDSIESAHRIASLDTLAASRLCDAANAIVLVEPKASSSLSKFIAPNLSEIGLFLPTTTLHYLLLSHIGRPVVVTSANTGSEPILYDDDSAFQELSSLADVILSHDRPIVRPIDDSVVRSIATRSTVVRLGRGLAPLTLPIPFSTHRILAVGGHQKVALALSNGHQSVLGPHVGDMESIAARTRFAEQAKALQTLYRCEADVIVHDGHPDYFTTRWAQSTGVRTIAVQHHHAHAVSAMFANGWLDREVLAVVFDGTGYGTDGTIWGGEFLRATVRSFERVASLRPFPLFGGDLAVRAPWRVAFALLVDSMGEDPAIEFLRQHGPLNANFPAQSMRQIVGLPAPQTTSAGRLFDGVASLILGLSTSDYDGEPAQRLEATAGTEPVAGYSFDFGGMRWTEREGEVSRLTNAVESTATPNASLWACHLSDTDRESFQTVDWRPAIQRIVADIQTHRPVADLAARFHQGLADAIVQICQQHRLPVVLSGGVFQNALLTERVVAGLTAARIEYGLHQSIPPNDGGLAAGQLAIAQAILAEEIASVQQQSGVSPCA